ncbi:MAG: tryptophan 2,3-dioxygenase family protein [Gemmatimonadota bacterium]
MSEPIGDSEVTYGTYLAVDELLRLQRPRSVPEHPDELLFIVVHQASELWFKVILHELDVLASHLEGGDTVTALTTMGRVNALVRIVAAQLKSLDSLPPQRFVEFRGYLGTASGGQSVQFRTIEVVSGLRDEHFIRVLGEHGPMPDATRRALERPTLQALFLGHLARHQTTLEAVYRDTHPSLFFLLAESFIEYEQGFELWRFLHVQLVQRIIGPEAGGTGGTLGARYLQRTLSQRFFPELWEVRSRFFGG